MAKLPPGLLSFIRQAPQAPVNPMSLIPRSSPDPTLQMRMQQAYKQKMADEAAQKIGGIMGQQAGSEMMGPPDLQGNMQQQDTQGSGMYEGASQQQAQQLEFAQGLIESGNPMLQDQGLSVLQKIQAGGKPADISMMRTFAIGDEDGKMIRARLADNEQGYRTIGGAYDPRNPFLDIGTDFVDPNDPNRGVKKNLSKAEQNKARGKNIVAAEESALKNYQSLVDRTGIYDEIITSIDEGANTSALTKWAPTLKASTARLESAGNRLALNLLTTVTMGSLSKSEMDILQQTVLPKMPAEDLKKWVQQRKAAELKLSRVYLDAAEAYASGEGRTAYIARKTREADAAKSATKPTRVWGQ